MHVFHWIKTCSQRTYILRTLRSQGLRPNQRNSRTAQKKRSGQWSVKAVLITCIKNFFPVVFLSLYNCLCFVFHSYVLCFTCTSSYAFAHARLASNIKNY